MKKCFTLIMAIMFSAVVLKGQTMGGPDQYGYVWVDQNDTAGQAYNWIDITGLPGASLVSGLDDDNSVGPYPIGFNFHFYWYDVSNFWVGSNGYLGFTVGQLSAPFDTIPYQYKSHNFVAGFAADLMFSNDTSNKAKCYTWNNANNDTLIVSYIDVPFYDASGPAGVGSNTFQIILSAVDSSITYQYKDQQGASATPPNCVIGIENNTGQVGLQHSRNVYPTANTCVKYLYPKTTTYQVSDASPVFNGNSTTGGIFLSVGDTYTMTTQVQNSGNQPLPSFPVYSRIQNNALAFEVQDTANTMALNPGQTESFTFTKTWTNNAAGGYRFITDTQLPSDANVANNTVTQEIVVVDTTNASTILSYDSGFDAGLGGLNWTGGTGGAGIYFEPPFYPCNVKEILSYLVNDGACSMLLFDDDGPNKGPGTVIDSLYLDSTLAQADAWNVVQLTTPYQVDSGGVYALWVMNGAGATLGQNNAPPYSNRCYEYINGAWGPYRYGEQQDVMINLNIASLYVSVDENNADSFFSNAYPNPTGNISTITYSIPNAGSKVSYSVFDMQGRVVIATKENLPQSGRIDIDVNSFSPGIYYTRILVDGEPVVRRIVVTK